MAWKSGASGAEWLTVAWHLVFVLAWGRRVRKGLALQGALRVPKAELLQLATDALLFRFEWRWLRHYRQSRQKYTIAGGNL